ncbi:glycosyltransferase [Formosa sediminum]|uniref:Glycosyltransferase n=1 Tax=Formosa sediminum TaxID=2594004 RepID=A0A516GS08_9FLAO|nr:glycosyltransferase [Formosa sediminum]QDO94311.1 glycosyltransferase [Formosa sediminum]
MKTKIKLIFILPDLTSGGAERVVSFIANNISKEKFDTQLWLAGSKQKTPYNTDSIKVKYFNKTRVLNAIPDFIKGFAKTKPDVVVSSIAHVNTAIALISVFFPKIKFIGREANVMSVVKDFSHSKNRFGNLIPINVSYKMLDIILCQSIDMREDMKSTFNIPESKLRIINNPITDSFKIKSTTDKTKPCIQFITVAQFKKQKGHERLLKILSQLDFEFHYTLIGKGPEQEHILKLIETYNLKDKITHIAFTKDVEKHLAASDFFLQGSYVEGFPNCLIESCAVGTPVLAYKAPGGLNEIIEDDVNGLVADSDEDYLNNIIKATTAITWDPKIVSESVYRKFNKTHILKQYEDLFTELSNT